MTIIEQCELPVLVSAVYGHSSPMLLDMVCRTRQDPMQLGLYIQTSIPISGTEDKHSIALVYTTDNLAVCSKGTTPNPLSKIKLDTIKRDNDPHIWKLHLDLKHPCEIWRDSGSPGTIEPQDGHEGRFNQFGDLTKAFMIDLVFDSKWIAQNSLVILRQMCRNARQVSPCSLGSRRF
jgi:hypothetical protein